MCDANECWLHPKGPKTVWKSPHWPNVCNYLTCWNPNTNVCTPNEHPARPHTLWRTRFIVNSLLKFGAKKSIEELLEIIQSYYPWMQMSKAWEQVLANLWMQSGCSAPDTPRRATNILLQSSCLLVATIKWGTNWWHEHHLIKYWSCQACDSKGQWQTMSWCADHKQMPLQSITTESNYACKCVRDCPKE